MESPIKTPKWANEQQLATLKEKSLVLVSDVKEKTGPALMRAMDSIGLESQKRMQQVNNLMSKSVDSLLTGLDGKSPTGERLLELRSTMDQLNPHSLHNSWWFSWMPKSIKRKAISNFVHKYQPLNQHVNQILNGLREGKDDLIESSIEMEHQYKEIEAAQREIQSDIFIGENLIAEIEALEQAADSDDAQEQQKLASAKNKAARRIRDLRTKEQAAIQFFISIDQTIATNELLMEQIDSALSVGPMVMTNALRIQAALAKQETVKQAVDEFQQGLGDMMAQNAQAVNQAAQQVGDLYNNPVIAIEKLEEGFDQLMQAVNTANETMQNSTIKAREASARLADMSEALEPIAKGMHESHSEISSLNADQKQQNAIQKEE
jgi:uncharacterized protein YaaN involved in tellurite resistance